LLYGNLHVNYIMTLFDCHAHHPSLHGERVFQQGVDNYGIHPWSITAENADRLIVEFDKRILNNLFISIGECGLDKCCEAPFGLQRKCFLHQVLKSEELHLPLIIHCVKAIDELLQIKSEVHPVQPWILHGFRGKPQQMLQLLDKGFYFSFGFKHNEESLALCPADYLFLETDESREDIRMLYESVAEVRNIPFSTLLYIIEQNVSRVFGVNCCSFQH